MVARQWPHLLKIRVVLEGFYSRILVHHLLCMVPGELMVELGIDLQLADEFVRFYSFLEDLACADEPTKKRPCNPTDEFPLPYTINAL